MSRKNILLIGTVLSFLFFYFCIQIKISIYDIPEPKIAETTVTKLKLKLKENDKDIPIKLSDIIIGSDMISISHEQNISTNAVSIIESAIPDKIDTFANTQKAIDELLKSESINFKLQSSDILEEGTQTLDKVIALINQLQDELSVIVAGHTNASGNKVDNLVLSQARAYKVKKYLEKNGLESTQISAIGYGEEHPILNNPTDRLNRRIEIHITQGE